MRRELVAPIAPLQRAVGNRAMGRLVQRACCAACAAREETAAERRPSRMHPKLTVSQPRDSYEREADEVASRLVGKGDPARAGGSGGGGSLQRAAAEGASGAGSGEAPAQVAAVLGQGGGEPLDAATRAFFEPRFGHDFGQVRVHTGARGAASAAAVNALAYTVGHHIVFAPGQFAPGTAAGRALLAHELTHVVQQGLPRSLSPHAAPGEGDPARGAPEQAFERAAARPGLDSVASVEAQVQRQTVPGLPPRFQRGCDDLLAEIIARVIELKERAQALIDNPFNLPPTGPMSVAGHQQQFANKQVNLRQLLNDWNTNNCGGPGGPRLPADAWSWATRSVPSPAPSRAPRVVTEPRREPIVTPGRVGAAVGIGVGLYVAYRVIRMLPSLLPPLWWTIPANVAVP